MYDLQNDPNEMRNIYDDPAHADIRRDLHQKLQDLRTKYDDSSGEQA
jgi:hypothetical protein